MPFIPLYIVQKGVEVMLENFQYLPHETNKEFHWRCVQAILDATAQDIINNNEKIQ